MGEEPANPGRGKTEENKEAAQRGVAGAPGKLSTLFSAGTPGAEVIYGPCQVEGGETRERGREGLPLRRACETVGPREAAVIPIALQEAPEIPLLTHRRCSAAGAAGREEGRPAERVDVLLYLGAQVLSTL